MTTNPCKLDNIIAGPFPQTLFLGMSIRNFNLNLGWGGEASSCSVKLAYDNAHHWSHQDYNRVHTNIDSKLGTATKDRASQALTSSSLEASDLQPDGNLHLHTAPAKKLSENQKTRSTEQFSHGGPKRDDTGKKIWRPGFTNPIDWVGPDPGFLADDFGMLRDIDPATRNMDIMGSLVHFRYDDVIFNGLIKNWSYQNGLVDVTLDGPTNLIKGTKLIIKDYNGTVNTRIEGAFSAQGTEISVPFDDPTLDPNDLRNTIYQGNIPNLVNVFGYLGIERAGYTESRGVSLGRVYDGVVELLGAAAPNGANRNRWNPYGCIIGKAARDRNTAAYLNYETTIKTTFGAFTADHWNIFNTRPDLANINRPHIFLDLSDVPRPPDSVYINDVTISLQDFIDKCCEPLGFDYWFELQTVTPGSAYDAAIKVQTVSRRFQPPVNLIRNLALNFNESDFVTDYRVGQEFQDAKTRTIVMGGKQQRLLQVGTNNLGRFRHRRVYEPSIDSFIDFEFGRGQNYLREPSTSKSRNLVDQPNSFLYAKNGAVVAQPQPDDFNLQETHPQTEQNILRGSYLPVALMTDEFGFTFKSSEAGRGPDLYDLTSDLIKPYFGQDLNGINRSTFFQQGKDQQYMGELFVKINTADLAQLFSAGDAPNLTGDVNVSESELRAAAGGFNSWLNYTFEMPVLGKGVGTADYIYIYLRDKYGALFATNFFLNAVSIFTGDKSKLTDFPAPRSSAPLSLETFLPYSDALYPILTGIQDFYASLFNEHYGKTWLVQLPKISSFVDGLGQRMYTYNIADRAWEEPGNFIDDTIQIGGTVANQIANEDGTFGVLLGFNNSAEYDAYFDETVVSKPNDLADIQSQANRFIALTAQKNPNNYYWPLVHGIPRQDVFYLPYTQQTIDTTKLPPGTTTIGQVPGLVETAHKFDPPAGSNFKMYCKGTVVDVSPSNPDYSKLTYYNGTPHCVVSAPSNVFVASTTSLGAAMMEEMIVHTRPEVATNVRLKKIRYTYLLHWSRSEKGLQVSGTDLANNIGASSNLAMGLRAAHPVFVAVPLVSNVSCYGPWTTHPGLGYENDNQLFTDPNPVSQINNLVGEVNFSQEPDAQPWNYGGMRNLDDAILTRISNSNYYQQVLENGYVTTAGVLFNGANLGSRLVENGPLINSIGIQIGEDGFTTTYNMRTYNRKLGFFNKQSADQIQERGRQFIAQRQLSAYKTREAFIENIVRASKFSSGGVSGGVGGGGGNANRGTGKNPNINNLLVGGAAPYLQGTSSLTKDKIFGAVPANLGFGPTWPYRPYVPPGQAMDPSQFFMQKTLTMLFDENAVGNMLAQDFDKKAVMSLDGLLSPVSFYPTPYGGTFPMTFYHRSECPICKGKGVLEYQELQPPDQEDGITDTDSINDEKQQKTEDNCPFCKPEAVASIEKGFFNRTTPSLITPPVLLIDGDDKIVQVNNNDPESSDTESSDSESSDTATDTEDGDYSAPVIQPMGAGNKINKFTLNPIVMSQGEFSLNADAKAEGDLCGHSIDVVAFGQDPPTGGNSLRSTSSSRMRNNYDKGVNQRFFGLRGPLVVHGWGYDREGYPVPNGSGELKLVNGKAVSITQELDENGEFTEPYPLNRFYKGWAQNPGCWPVGPVDLRWDNQAGVWTVGSNYKNVWVTIEIDLKGGQPTRGTIYEDAAETLPNGFRKLVFVRDTSGGYAAPRGADIYCQYDPDSGYYIPLYNQSLVASGTMESAASATIYQSYTKNYDEANPTSYNAGFENPLGLQAKAGKAGLFTYVNGQWILQNVGD